MSAPHGMHPPGQAPAVVAVLVVGGDHEKRTATVLALEPLGHTIVEARSGEAALSLLAQRTFAVILMDVELPGINGYEVVERIRVRSASEYTPIILMASPARDEAAVPIAYASGATDFVVVPAEPAILRAKVSAYVDLFAKTRALEQAVSHAKALNEEFRDSEVRTRAVLDVHQDHRERPLRQKTQCRLARSRLDDRVSEGLEGERGWHALSRGRRRQDEDRDDRRRLHGELARGLRAEVACRPELRGRRRGAGFGLEQFST